MNDRDDEQTAPQPGSGLAITSLVLGVVGLPFFPLAIVALVFGIIALTKGQSKGLAIPGVVLGGLGTLVAPIAIIAAIAIPNLLESRITANEALARSALKASVFPAEVQFQAGSYRDRDKDGIGDFGFFPEMAGGPVNGKDDVRLTLLPSTWNSPQPTINGYRFAVFLPDGKGGAIGQGQDGDLEGSDHAQGPQSNFVAYAWPSDPSVGRHVFALTADGIVYAPPPGRGPFTAPKWNDLFGGKGWKDEKAWQPYRR